MVCCVGVVAGCGCGLGGGAWWAGWRVGAGFFVVLCWGALWTGLFGAFDGDWLCAGCCGFAAGFF